MDRRFVSAKELALYMCLNEETIRKMAHRGTLPYAKFGKSLRFDLWKIDSWIKKREVDTSKFN